jgi:hypothetical protein
VYRRAPAFVALPLQPPTTVFLTQRRTKFARLPAPSAVSSTQHSCNVPARKRNFRLEMLKRRLPLRLKTGGSTMNSKLRLKRAIALVIGGTVGLTASLVAPQARWARRWKK